MVAKYQDENDLVIYRFTNKPYTIGPEVNYFAGCHFSDNYDPTAQVLLQHESQRLSIVKKMERIDRLVRYGSPILAVITIVLIAVLLKYPPYLFSFVVADTERSLTIRHDIQTKQQLNDCMYSISILVSDMVTKKAIPDSLVEFQTNSNNVVTNTTDQNGATEISLVLEEEPGRTCMEKLLSEGYSIVAFKTGYAGHGMGTIS